MKKILPILLLITLLGAVGCESDDLCDHSVNTPRLVVRFYNQNNTRTPFSVANLTVYGEGNTTPLVSNSTLDSLALPLKLESPTTYLFQTVVSGTTTSTATLTLTYNSEQSFVSKACGIKITYNTLSATIQDANTSWLKGLNLKNTTVDNEKRAHIHLYH
ncbi:hypothetical protein RCZ04_00190 [Capnocytophaga sp. HP1101]